VLVPRLASRIEEPDDAPGLRIDPREIRPFVQVAVIAGEGEVIGVVGAAVLPGDDVLDVKRDERDVLLQQPTVFAAPPSPRSNEIADGSRRHAPEARTSAPRALVCRIVRKSRAAT
jgi:hypothetical protein